MSLNKQDSGILPMNPLMYYIEPFLYCVRPLCYGKENIHFFPGLLKYRPPSDFEKTGERLQFSHIHKYLPISEDSSHLSVTTDSTVN